MAKKINARERWIYNARDCAATIGAFNVLLPMADQHQLNLYRAGMALEAATFAIQQRGIKVDLNIRKAVLKELEVEFAGKVKEMEEIAGNPVNPNSPDQIRKLFYDTLGLKEMKNKDGAVSVDRSVLERIEKGRVDLAVPVARGTKTQHVELCASLARLILEARGIAKDKGMVKSKLDDGRIRTSLNVGATESFRFSASKTCFGRGANLQQVRHKIRRMMIADPGLDMVYADQDRAESTAVAYLSGDPAYIKAHQAHDTHVEVAKLIWPDEPWPGDDKGDLALASEPNFIRFFSRRDMSKRTQHALNYYPPGPLAKYKLKGKGPHHTLARELQIPKAQAYDIVNMYFRSFKGIQDWQQEVIDAAKKTRRVYYPGGYYRDLFGRSREDKTHREAISSIPQFIIAWTNHAVMVRLWKEFDKRGEFEMLLHTHDAVLFQCKDWEMWKPKVEPLTAVKWPGKNEPFTIAWSFDVGTNWEEAS